MESKLPKIFLARHGQTEWSLSGRHTGRSDIALTECGENDARALGKRLAKLTFSEVWTSPLIRAKHSCELAGFESSYQIETDLMEWHYGDYEGLFAEEIQAKHPGWNVFKHGCPNGESPEDILARTSLLTERLKLQSSNILLFSHGHFLRSLAATWINEPLIFGNKLKLSTSGLSILSFNHDNINEPAILSWNDVGHISL